MIAVFFIAALALYAFLWHYSLRDCYEAQLEANGKWDLGDLLFWILVITFFCWITTPYVMYEKWRAKNPKSLDPRNSLARKTTRLLTGSNK